MTQLYRTMTTELRTLLHSSQILEDADLYTIELTGGQQLRWTDKDRPVTVVGNTWSVGPGLERSLMEWRVGVEAQEMTFTVTADASVQVNGIPLLRFIRQGGLSGAQVTLERAFRGETTTADLLQGIWVGKLHQTWGNVSEIRPAGRGQFEIAVRSPTEGLAAPLPPSVFQAQCRNQIYDEKCGKDREAATWTDIVTGASDSLRLTFGHDLPQAVGFFDLGAVTFTTGANAGVKRTVRSHGASLLTAMQPWPAPIAPGDVYKVYPGCARTENECDVRHNNKGRFRGFPHVPPPETIL